MQGPRFATQHPSNLGFRGHPQQFAKSELATAEIREREFANADHAFDLDDVSTQGPRLGQSLLHAGRLSIRTEQSNDACDPCSREA
ncbi:MAG: hypothetical protein ACI9F9_001748 [Candidatus Paceibacteria bacterium]|jgi:hypothetical protein